MESLHSLCTSVIALPLYTKWAKGVPVEEFDEQVPDLNVVDRIGLPVNCTAQCQITRRIVTLYYWMKAHRPIVARTCSQSLQEVVDNEVCLLSSVQFLPDGAVDSKRTVTSWLRHQVFNRPLSAVFIEERVKCRIGRYLLAACHPFSPLMDAEFMRLHTLNGNSGQTGVFWLDSRSPLCTIYNNRIFDLLFCTCLAPYPAPSVLAVDERNRYLRRIYSDRQSIMSQCALLGMGELLFYLINFVYTPTVYEQPVTVPMANQEQAEFGAKRFMPHLFKDVINRKQFDILEELFANCKFSLADDVFPICFPSGKPSPQLLVNLLSPFLAERVALTIFTELFDWLPRMDQIWLLLAEECLLVKAANSNKRVSISQLLNVTAEKVFKPDRFKSWLAAVGE